MRKNKDLKYMYNSTVYSLVGYYKGYSIWSSTFMKGVIQIRDFKGIRIMGYCTKENIDNKIKALDTFYTFYG